jgi:hypothetical protein
MGRWHLAGALSGMNKPRRIGDELQPPDVEGEADYCQGRGVVAAGGCSEVGDLLVWWRSMPTTCACKRQPRGVGRPIVVGWFTPPSSDEAHARPNLGASPLPSVKHHRGGIRWGRGGSSRSRAAPQLGRVVPMHLAVPTPGVTQLADHHDRMSARGASPPDVGESPS